MKKRGRLLKFDQVPHMSYQMMQGDDKELRNMITPDNESSDDELFKRQYSLAN